MNKQNIAKKHPLQPPTLMGKGSYAPDGQQGNKAVAVFYDCAFRSQVMEITLATNCLQ